MKTVRLSDIALIQSGGTPKRSNSLYWENGNIPWVKIGDIKSKYLKECEEFITVEGLKNSSAKIFNKGSILYTIFATLGEVAILDMDAVTNQAIAGITVQDKRVNVEYLYYYLKSIKHDVNNLGRGVAQNNINLSILKNLSIPIRSDCEQIKIVNCLNFVTKIIEQKNRQLNLLDELVKSRFIEMFGDVPESEKVTMAAICKIITDGTHQPPKFTNVGIPFLFVSNIVTNEICYDAEKFISEETYAELLKRTPIEVGDILLSTVGSYGHPAIVKTSKRFCFQRHIAYLKPKSDMVDSEYLRGAILSDNVQRQIDERVKGIAQKTLNLSEIRKIKLPLPPMEMQKRFAAFVVRTDKSRLLFKCQLLQYHRIEHIIRGRNYG